MKPSAKAKIEYGDFQTPIELAEQICAKLLELGVNPDVIIEPTCGIGTFIKASCHCFPSAREIIGVEINPDYIEKLHHTLQHPDHRIEIYPEDFFIFDWQGLIEKLDGEILVIGNFPWVTNARQGAIAGKNLPQKNNFQHHIGLDAITGKSNFDISEWMLIRMVQMISDRHAYLAMLCKNSVSRKLLHYIHNHSLNLHHCAFYPIDTKRYFNAHVSAGLLFCQFDRTSKNTFCDVFQNLEDKNYQRIGYENDILVRDIITFQAHRDLYTSRSENKWRSGVKHDRSDVMEITKVDNGFINGFGEKITLEETYLYPLLKGSDIARGRTESTDRYVIVPQKAIGENTEPIQNLAPKTWEYLMSHGKYLDSRQSKIYQNKPRFSIFGVGEYTFAPWKVAICGLYKKLDFRAIGAIDHKPVVFDDTVYFLPCEDEESANHLLEILTSQIAQDFYSSLIFWDEKRPIKTQILNRLHLETLARKLSESETERSDRA
jgi:hypothetical protein